MNTKITNEQIKEAISNVEIYLGKMSVSGDNVFVLAECRSALRQIITLIPKDFEEDIEEDVSSELVE